MAKLFWLQARIVNIVDWRALRPGADHLPYTISKAALASMTKPLATALAPKVIVNPLALSAILAPADGNKNPDIIKSVPFNDGQTQTGYKRQEYFCLLARCI